MPELLHYSTAVFDSLGNVVEVSKKVASRDLQALFAVIKKFDLVYDVGVSLAHRHVDLLKNEILLEDDNENGSVTSPVDIDTVLNGCLVPSAWMFRDKCGWYPISFRNISTEKFVASGGKLWWQNAEFMQEIGEEFVKHGISEVYTLASLPKYVVSGSVPPEGLGFLETTDAERKSIIQLAAIDPLGKDVVRTMYTADEKVCISCFPYCRIGDDGHNGRFHAK